MTVKEYDFKASELRELEEMLAGTPVECVLERFSLESRLSTVKLEVENISSRLKDLDNVPKVQ